MIRVILPPHLRVLAQVDTEVQIQVSEPVTQTAIMDALEKKYPMLYGTIRDPATGKRRPFLRFFSCQCDVSHNNPDGPVPDPVSSGTEPFIIVGAIAGG
jgi:hypothetical protein